jgi:organic hydroperoxide reductase OsmC/OhrA
MDTTIRILSNNLGIPLASLAVDVQADCDVRGTLLVDPSVRVGFNVMRVSVKALPGPGVTTKQVEDLVQMAEKCCVVLHTLRNGVDVAFQLDAGEEADAAKTRLNMAKVITRS